MGLLGVLGLYLRTNIRKLERELIRVQQLDKEIITLRKQNATLTEAAKSYNPTYDIGQLFKGGF
jgi:cell shape-determining protein MreC